MKPKEKQMIGRLILTQNNGKKHTAFIKKNEGVTLGRGKDTDIKILDTRLSRIHCKVIEEEGSYYIVDAGSTNGTFLNDEKVERAQLSDGDSIAIGTTGGEFNLVDESETEEKAFGSTLRFCVECGGSISDKDIERGRVEKVEGGFLCGECVLAKKGVPVDIERATERVETVLKTPEGIDDAMDDESGILDIGTADEAYVTETEAEEEEKETAAAGEAEVQEVEAEEIALDENIVEEPAEAEEAPNDEVIELSDEDVEAAEEISEDRAEEDKEPAEKEVEQEEPLELIQEKEAGKAVEAGPEEEQGPAGRVVLTQNNGRESTVIIREGDSITVGRGRSCGLRVLDTRMSREHCTFFEKEGAYYIRDEGSTNGTFLNSGKVTEEEKLTEGDIINAGTSEGRFSILRDSEVRRQTGITFCAVCGGSISNQDIQNGMAKEIEGGFYCRDCVLEKEGIPPEVEAATDEVEKVSLDEAVQDEKKEVSAEPEEVIEPEEAEIVKATELIEEAEEEEPEETEDAPEEALEVEEAPEQEQTEKEKAEEPEIPAEPIIPSEDEKEKESDKASAIPEIPPDPIRKEPEEKKTADQEEGQETDAEQAERKETEVAPEEEAVPSEQAEEEKAEKPEIPSESIVSSKEEEVAVDAALESEEEDGIPELTEAAEIEETGEPEEGEASAESEEAEEAEETEKSEDIEKSAEEAEGIEAEGAMPEEEPEETPEEALEVGEAPEQEQTEKEKEEVPEEPAPAHDTAAIAVLKNQAEIGPEELLMPEELKRAEELRKLRESGGSELQQPKEKPKKEEKPIEIQDDDGSQWFLTLLGRRIGPIGRRKMTELKRKQQLGELQEVDLEGL